MFIRLPAASRTSFPLWLRWTSAAQRRKVVVAREKNGGLLPPAGAELQRIPACREHLHSGQVPSFTLMRKLCRDTHSRAVARSEQHADTAGRTPDDYQGSTNFINVGEHRRSENRFVFNSVIFQTHIHDRIHREHEATQPKFGVKFHRSHRDFFLHQ